MEWKNGLHWYYYLNPKDEKANGKKGLFSEHSRGSVFGKLLVCWDYLDMVTQRKTKLYHLFENYIHFAKFFLSLPYEHRSFFEVIIGELPQKPHFDVDMEISVEEYKSGIHFKVLEDLISVVMSLIPEIKIEKDVCIYSSTLQNPQINKDGEIKISYHLVINHFCHASNTEAKAFYFNVIKLLPKEYYENRWIDFSVYSVTQQFRIYNSAKAGTQRFKLLQEKFVFKGKEYKHVLDEEGDDDATKFLVRLEESIVGARVSNCKMLPSFAVPEEFSKKHQIQDGGEIDMEIAMEAISLLAQSVGMTPEDPKFPYCLDKCEGPFVVLKRLRPSKCRLCKRIHEHQNPYLFIAPDNKSVFFHCRRAPNTKNLYIGALKIYTESIEDVLNVKQSPVKEDFKKFEVVEGSVTQAVLNKEGNKVRDDWTANKLAKLKEIASSSNPLKPKKEKEKKLTHKEIDPKYRKMIVKNIETKILGEFPQ